MAKDILNVGGFVIKKRIGTGARSTIYLATDQQDNTDVALKRIIFERPEDSRVFEQTENEYKTAQRINHPYVRKCYKLKKIRTMLKVNEMLLSMEFFDGKSLEAVPTLSLVDVLLVFRMVASGLNAMHQQGFIHCDIKPNNILMSKVGSIKIIDLGQSCKNGTTKRRIQGTPAYIAPEQVRRKPLGPRTDIYNLGATMYWALTGKNVPTLIPQKNRVIGIVIPRSCPAPHELKKRIPIGTSRLVMECIKDNPAQRPPNMMTVISRLDLMIHSLIGSKIKTNKNASSNN
ncbi:MAG TPA: serine/threonine-protein kinase [Sedimentisphaerales bacterium]|nr:serine/threonine-protein kinase [Sedimentisphaerales bacterium]